MSIDEVWDIQADQEEARDNKNIKIIKSSLSSRQDILKAVGGTPKAFYYASEKLKNDREFFLEDLARGHCSSSWYDGDFVTIFHYASNSILEDKEIMLKAIKNNNDIYCLPPISFVLLMDKEFIKSSELKVDFEDYKDRILSWHIKNNNIYQIKKAIELDKQIAQTKYGKHSLLIKAIESDNIEIINQVFDNVKNIDFNYQVMNEFEGDGFKCVATALMAACERSNIEIIKRLIDIGVDLNIKNNYGESALSIAMSIGRLDIVELLLKHGANKNDLYNDDMIIDIVNKNALESLKYLISMGADINIKDECETSILILAIQQDFTEISELLILKGADCSGALSAVIWKNDIDKLKLFLSFYEKINFKKKDSLDAFAIAIERKNKEMIELLISYGIDVNAKNNKGQTAVMVAQSRYQYDKDIKEVLELLVLESEKKSNYTFKDKSNIAKAKVEECKEGILNIKKDIPTQSVKSIIQNTMMVSFFLLYIIKLLELPDYIFEIDGEVFLVSFVLSLLMEYTTKNQRKLIQLKNISMYANTAAFLGLGAGFYFHSNNIFISLLFFIISGVGFIWLYENEGKNNAENDI
jgi:ankyrin repeat protein